MSHKKLNKSDEKLLRGYCEGLPNIEGVNHFRRLKTAWLGLGQQGITNYLLKIKQEYVISQIGNKKRN
jgi:hypothetical protein